MSPRQVELALRKQRLQLRIGEQRLQAQEVLRYLDGVESGLQRVGEVTDWIRSHAKVLSVAAGLLALARPRWALRWLRRGWTGWRLWQVLRSEAFDVLKTRG